jgi:hypothetical protein
MWIPRLARRWFANMIQPKTTIATSVASLSGATYSASR